ncbi:MAG: glycosyltransferase [Paludibacteraceae bacterium]|nr:glycosyltransferase [Paludibacteraceae bacterium]
MANDKRTHILVVSDPPVAPGYLPRLRYLCDYLDRKGFAVTLLTETSEPLPFAHNYPIETIRMYSGNTFDWFVKTVWTLLTDWHNRVFAKRALTTLHGGFDLVLCTAFSDFPLGAAQRIAQTLQVPLICDIRDLDEQVDDSRYQYQHQQWWLMPFRRLYRAIHIRRRNKVLRAANAITTVSPWHKDFIQNITANSVPVYTIYNGFDEQQFYPENIRTEQFTITYIGSLFHWQIPALEKVKQAVEGIRIQMDIHTPQDHPVAHDRLGDAIRRSGIMLVLTSPNTHGMLTTKFYEALGCAKPILCVPSDQGALAELMAYTNAGIATDDIEAIKAFILQHYRSWEQNGFTAQQTQHREEFSREAQTKQMEQILLSTINK